MPKKGVHSNYHYRQRRRQSPYRKKSSPSDIDNQTIEDTKTTSDVQDITNASSTEQTGDRNNAVSNIISQETSGLENNNDNISGNSDDGYQSDDNVIEEEISSIQNLCSNNESKGVACVSNNNQNEEVRNIDMELLNKEVEDTTENMLTQSQNFDDTDGSDDEVDVLPTQQHTQSFDNVSVESDDDVSADGYSSVSSVSSSLRVKKLRAKALIISSLTSVGSFRDQCSLLKSVLSSPVLEKHVTQLRIQNSKDQVKIESFDNLAELLSFSSPPKR